MSLHKSRRAEDGYTYSRPLSNHTHTAKRDRLYIITHTHINAHSDSTLYKVKSSKEIKKKAFQHNDVAMMASENSSDRCQHQ